MAHNYVISTVNVINDQVQVTGTVDGTPVQIQFWISSAGNNMASAIAFRNYIAPLMLAAIPPAPVAQPILLQTFTQ